MSSTFVDCGWFVWLVFSTSAGHDTASANKPEPHKQQPGIFAELGGSLLGIPTLN